MNSSTNFVYSLRYIFVYILRPDNKMMDAAKFIAKKMHCKIVYMGLYNNHYRGVRSVNDGGIEEFLSAIANAEAIITNSFHGTVFSVLFERHFASIKINSTSSRVENLLQLLRLDEHLISDLNDIDILYEDYDHEFVSKTLEEERKKSVDYLKSIIC